LDYSLSERVYQDILVKLCEDLCFVLFCVILISDQDDDVE